MRWYSEPMKTNRQVEIFLFKHTREGVRFLMLKRNPQKGGFWQPVTGGVHEGETDEQAALREVLEETGIQATNLLDTAFTFEYKHENKVIHEHVFGLEVPENAAVQLSSEHTKLVWATKTEALDKYLKWTENKQGLQKLTALITLRDMSI